MAGAEGEEGTACVIGEFFAVAEGHGLSPALQHFVVVGVDYVEGVPGERPDFFAHYEGGLVGHAVRGVYAKGRLDWGELCHCWIGD